MECVHKNIKIVRPYRWSNQARLFSSFKQEEKIYDPSLCCCNDCRKEFVFVKLCIVEENKCLQVEVTLHNGEKEFTLKPEKLENISCHINEISTHWTGL